MAQKITVELQDDLDGGPADETVRFEVDSDLPMTVPETLRRSGLN